MNVCFNFIVKTNQILELSAHYSSIPTIKPIVDTLFRSRESTMFIYELSEMNGLFFISKIL